MSDPQVLTVQATDVAGNTTLEPLIVQMVGGAFLRIEPRDGKKLLVDAAELREVLES